MEIVVNNITQLRAYENTIFEKFNSELNNSTKAVFKAISKYSLSATGKAFPKHSTIAEIAKVSVSTVKRQVKLLESLGVLKVEARIRKNGGRSSNLYIFLMPDDLSNDLSGEVETTTESKDEGAKKNSSLISIYKKTVNVINNINNNKMDENFSIIASKMKIDYVDRLALWLIAKQENALQYSIDALQQLAPYINGFRKVKKSLGALYRTIIRAIKDEKIRQELIKDHVEENKDNVVFYNWLDESSGNIIDIDVEDPFKNSVLRSPLYNFALAGGN